MCEDKDCQVHTLQKVIDERHALYEERHLTLKEAIRKSEEAQALYHMDWQWEEKARALMERMRNVGAL